MEEVKELLEGIDKNKFSIVLTESRNKVSMTIHRKHQDCDVCSSKKHYKTLTIRQDSRVKFFMVGKKVCRTCLKDVNIILNNLKDSVQSPHETGRW